MDNEQDRLKRLDERQWIGVNKYIGAGANGTLEWATGIGKTHAFLKVYHRLRKRYPNDQINIVVPTDILYQAWMGNDGHIRKHKLTNLNVFILNTFIKESHEAILTCIDEVHTVLSDDAELFNQCIEKAVSPFKLGLSGSLTVQEKLTLNRKGMPVVDTITFDEGVKQGFISDVIIFNLGVSFTPKEQKEYDKWDKIHMQLQKYFQTEEGWFDYKRMEKCKDETEPCLIVAQSFGWHLDLGADHEHSPKKIKQAANLCFIAMINRKKVIQGAMAKMDMVTAIIDRFPRMKTIVFSERTSVVDTLISRYGREEASEYHSNIKNEVIENGEVIYTNVSLEDWKKIAKAHPFARKVSAAKKKKAALSAFEADRTRMLLTSRAVDAGYDLPDIELAIVHSGNSTIRQETQRKGRIARYVINKIAILVNIYVRDSQEVKWIKARQKKSRNVYWITDIKDIGTKPPNLSGITFGKAPAFQFGKLEI